MIKQTKKMAFFVAGCRVLCLSSLCGTAALTAEPKIRIVNHPQGQLVPVGATVTFSVVAAFESTQEKKNDRLSYQWQFNGTLLDGTNYWVDLGAPGATSSNITITNVQISKVGFYRVKVNSSAISDPAPLQAFKQFLKPDNEDPIIVYGTPIAASGGGNYCSGGPFAGYIPYTNNPPTAWGWAPVNTNSSITAADGVPTANSRVGYYGAYGDSGCGVQSVSKQPPFALPSGSPRYQFVIYFKGSVPTSPNPYPLVLTNLQ